MGSSWTRDQTSVLCIAREILNTWTTREAQVLFCKNCLKLKTNKQTNKQTNCLKLFLEAKFNVSIESFGFYNFQRSTLKPTGLPPLARRCWERRTESGRMVTGSLGRFHRSHTGVAAWRSTVTAAARGSLHEWVIPVWRPRRYFSLRVGIKVLTSKCPSLSLNLFCLLESAKDTL